MRYYIVALLGINVLFSCQNRTDRPVDGKQAIIRIEARASNQLVKYRSPQYSFSGMMATNYFRRIITAQDTLSSIDSLLSQLDGRIPHKKQEYIAGIIIHYETKDQDSIGFGYRGIYYRGNLYNYADNADLVRTVSSLLPPVNKFTLLLGINPDDKDTEQKLRDAIGESIVSDTTAVQNR